MYDDDYDKRDSRRLSFISSPLSESITIIPTKLAGCESPTSPHSLQVQNHINDHHNRQANGQPWPHGAKSAESSPTSPASTTSPVSTDTATTSFPLNDVDYESDPAAVAQELNNLAAIRRMSMDVAATDDPDLPSFSVPSIAPSPSDDENDASRLFWVPARLHPELAPKEFKSFLESKTEQIKRKSGDFSTLGPEREGSIGGLRRKRSMLSRQIDTSQGYTDGAERLERKRSQSKRDSLGPNLHELETIVNDSKPRVPNATNILDGIQKLGISTDEDKPILPPAPPSHSLRRSTRTQYRKAGSLKKGEKAPYSKRVARTSDADERVTSPTGSAGGQAVLGLTRMSTDPTPSSTRAQAAAKSTPGAPQAPVATTSTTIASSSVDSAVEQSQPANDRSYDAASSDPSNKASAPAQSRQWHSRISSNGRSTVDVPPSEQKIPEIIETPPPGTPTTPSTPTSQSHASPKAPAGQDRMQERSSSKRSAHSRTQKETTPTFNDFANTPQPLPGNTTRTDSLSYIPTFEDRKTDSKEKEKETKESKKSKDKKDSEGGRKSSWHWLLGSEDKDKEKKKDKDSDSKKLKAKLVDKVHETAHALPSSSDSSQRGRESVAVDRLDPKLEEERRKDNARRASGESKKEKESGLFSSIFGGSRKKSSGDSSHHSHHHKKSASRNLSPDPPVRELRPDVDYAWTRFSILEERAIYRMAHIKLANPRRALYSQVLLSNFMYSYLAKVQQMHPHMMLATSAAQRQQQKQQEEYQQYQRYQEVSIPRTCFIVLEGSNCSSKLQSQEQQYTDSSYDDPQMYEYTDDAQDHYGTHSQSSKGGYENGNAYGPGHYQYGHSTFGDDVQLDDDDDDMW
ncbi:putative telomere silencing protein Zds1 [Aspergillus vadensis CBS 113365]|uniref:Telomere silencing protein Zds1 n=1 Tax=Aspergillus vadensis (strain CBS 113365 / IMI 142717 / IBT 24658) TaxID=1448311 RepID=A0A319B7J0_ASPVC|nr:telomere silencing protein Zds1 [Aspergillus vadensis CBS 113365]PYH67764.1 telomere silencing protein Zds1 [Aspergillus vadensis CBS 113365]